MLSGIVAAGGAGAAAGADKGAAERQAAPRNMSRTTDRRTGMAATIPARRRRS
jgi:hypothetical protein